jgi:hypothetical protein
MHRLWRFAETKQAPPFRVGPVGFPKVRRVGINLSYRRNYPLFFNTAALTQGQAKPAPFIYFNFPVHLSAVFGHYIGRRFAHTAEDAGKFRRRCGIASGVRAGRPSRLNSARSAQKWAGKRLEDGFPIRPAKEQKLGRVF